MTYAAFEEKTYEMAYCVEMATGKGTGRVVFSPGQVLEKILGFDAAGNPGSNHLLWKALALPRPHGVHLIPPLWGALKALQPHAASLPSYPISIFLQFKRPQYLQGPGAKQWKMWRHAYYRFARTTEQQRVLARLERRLGGQAVVRYAAPAFHTIGQLESAQLKGSVITESGHVQPTRLQRHHVWTYDAPGNYGQPNPNGAPSVFETFDNLLEEALNRAPAGTDLQYWSGDPLEGLRQHLAVASAACREREPRLRQDVDIWAARLDELDIDERTATALRDLASIQSLMARTNGAWWLTGI